MANLHGYYLHYRDINDSSRKQTGIDLKVAGQIKALNQLGCECEFLYCPQPESVPDMVKSCLPFFPDGITWPDINTLEDPDFLYIRCPRFVSKELLHFLKCFKEKKPQSKVIYEIPTYPYDDGMKTVKMYPALLKDRKNRSGLKSYVDRVSDLSGTQTIFGIETVPFFNGIDLDRVEKREPSNRGDALRIMCAAFYCDWHGMDRAIKGLEEYYAQGGRRNIILHLAGAGDKLSQLKRMVSDAGLQDHVVFPGVLAGKELDNLYNSASLAIASLGMHRLGLEVASTLKTREYLAKGMPFVYSGKIDVFQNEPMEYSLAVPADDSPIDFESLVAFHDAMYENTSEVQVVDEIRAYAERNITMEAAMGKVADYLKDTVA